MKVYRLVLAILVVAVALLVMFPNLSWAEKTAEIFNNKCVACHGADGNAATAIGKKMNIPEFNSQKVQKASDAELTDFILNGGKEKRASHAFSGKGLSEAEGKDLAKYVKSLGKK